MHLAVVCQGFWSRLVYSRLKSVGCDVLVSSEGVWNIRVDVVVTSAFNGDRIVLLNGDSRGSALGPDGVDPRNVVDITLAGG